MQTDPPEGCAAMPCGDDSKFDYLELQPYVRQTYK